MSQKVTAEMVKQLRERTGVGMSKCKEALDQALGDMETAIDILRKAGIASAVKKEGRETKEGMIGCYETRESLVLIEVNAETDFVTQNEKFKEFVSLVAKEAAENKIADLEQLLAHKIASKQDSVDAYRSELIQSLGENIQIKRLSLFVKEPMTSFGLYSHMGGKIVTLVKIQGSDQFDHLAKDIAMHVAAEAPDYVHQQDVPADVIEREKEIAKAQACSTGKEGPMLDKIIEGKVKAFCDQVCLISQKYIKDNSLTIQQLLEKEGKSKQQTLTLSSFQRWKVGG
ncbi:MAG: translation elongation factor Ts [Rhabdochlamydiaceae bacterium]